MNLQLAILLLTLFASGAFAKTLVIYHDADYSGHASSAESMAMGLETALSEVSFRMQGYDLKLVPKDHRGNVKRSKLHMKQFLDDSAALFVLGGLHSPPYLANKDYINQNQIPLIIPWAAAGPITRTNSDQNWIFRLSIDDSKAGIRLADYAIHQAQCQSPQLLLENTGWGKSNYKTVTEALSSRGRQENGVTWFEWNTEINAAKQLLHEIVADDADCIIYVGNAIEGGVFAKAIASFPEAQRLPIISHWGLTGGSFHELYKKELHGLLNLSFLQTCFSFNTPKLTGKGAEVFKAARMMFSNKIDVPEDILAPPGFVHSYDIGQVLIAALKQIKLTGDIKKDRANLRIALESIQMPVMGLIKTYEPPFSAWQENKSDAHEALGLGDLCMASYDRDGVIRLK